MAKFKVGDIVIIKHNFCDHEFEIGEAVRVIRLVEGKVFKAEKLDKSESWCIDEDEIKKPTKKDLLKISETLIEGL